MNNEIKEILDKIKKVSNREEASYNLLIETEPEKYKLLLDYITNLREENEDLREENKEAHDFDETMKDIKDNLIARINRQECEIHNLQQRIDRAIEYIENNFISYEDSRTFGQLGEEIEIQVKEIRDLLKILKGDSSNE